MNVEVQSCTSSGMIPRNLVDCLYAASALTFAYLCAGELLPVQFMKSEGWDAHEWQRQQVVSISILSLLAVLLGSPRLGMQKDFGRSNIVSRTFIVMNVVPIATTIATTTWVMRSDNCPLDPQRECKPLSMILDSIGLVDRETRTVRPWSLLATGHARSVGLVIPSHRRFTRFHGKCSRSPSRRLVLRDPVCPPLDRIFMFLRARNRATLFAALLLPDPKG